MKTYAVKTVCYVDVDTESEALDTIDDLIGDEIGYEIIDSWEVRH